MTGGSSQEALKIIAAKDFSIIQRFARDLGGRHCFGAAQDCGKASYLQVFASGNLSFQLLFRLEQL